MDNPDRAAGALSTIQSCSPHLAVSGVAVTTFPPPGAHSALVGELLESKQVIQ